MNEKDVKKMVELQGKILKLRERIEADVRRHNKMITEELRPMTEDILHNTIYQVGMMTYKRGRVFCQIRCEDYGLGTKAEGLATLRKLETEDIPDAPTDDTASGSSTPLSE
jgi:hypothetical protein